jgi:hypothetical protein
VLRQAGALAQDEVAERMRHRGFAVTQSYLCRVEAGKRKAPAEVLNEIAAVIVAIVDERQRNVHELLTA